MNIADHPAVLSLADTDDALLPFFSRTERLIIEVCKEVVRKNERGIGAND